MTWTIAQAMAYIQSLKAAGMKPGLARMERALALLNNPQKRLRTVHIAGTNGKGSTGRMIQSILTAAGYRTGRFDSPPVMGLRQTLTLDGEAISAERFAALTQRMAALQEKMGKAGGLTEFELVTAMALLWFAEEKTDICVLECGMGGRDDATNVVGPPLTAVLTPVALDHMAVLGKTVEEIASVKCGILKPPCGVVTSPSQSPAALGVLLERAAALGLTVRQPVAAAAELLEEDWGQLRFVYDGEEYRLPLTGAFQRDNALTAIETVRCLAEKGFPVEKEAVSRGLAAAEIPCRQEVFSREPLIVLDGAHNPHGMAALAATLGRLLPGRRMTAVFGMLRDKDTAACAALLGPHCKRMVCCAPPNPRALEAEELARQASSYCGEVAASVSPAEALRLAGEQAGDGPLLIAGSLYLCEAIRPILLEKDIFRQQSTETPFI